MGSQSKHLPETESRLRRNMIYKVDLPSGPSLLNPVLLVYIMQKVSVKLLQFCVQNSLRKRENLVFICVKVTGDNGAGCNKFLSLINASESQKGEVCFVIRYVLSFTLHQSDFPLQSSVSHPRLRKNRVCFVQMYLHLMNVIYYRACDAGPTILPKT